MACIEALQHQLPAKAIYNKLTRELTEVDDAPRNPAVVHDKKFRDARTVRRENGTEHCRTFGDEFQSMFHMVQTDSALPDPFVRFVVGSGQSVPSVIL